MGEGTGGGDLFARGYEAEPRNERGPCGVHRAEAGGSVGVIGGPCETSALLHGRLSCCAASLLDVAASARLGLPQLEFLTARKTLLGQVVQPSSQRGSAAEQQRFGTCLALMQQQIGAGLAAITTGRTVVHSHA